MFDVVLLGGLVVGIVQIAKVTFGITSRFIPITTLFVSGAIFGLFAFLSKTALDWNLVAGALVTALTSIGLWSGTKSTLL